jgi:hypothetical protein
MIVGLLHGVRRVDVMLHRKLGVAYNALLGIGLVVEIVRHLHEVPDPDNTSVIRTILAVTLFVLLLLHQLAELAEHVDRRFRNARETRWPDARQPWQVSCTFRTNRGFVAEDYGKSRTAT